MTKTISNHHIGSITISSAAYPSPVTVTSSGEVQGSAGTTGTTAVTWSPAAPTCKTPVISTAALEATLAPAAAAWTCRLPAHHQYRHDQGRLWSPSKRLRHQCRLCHHHQRWPTNIAKTSSRPTSAAGATVLRSRRRQASPLRPTRSKCAARSTAPHSNSRAASQDRCKLFRCHRRIKLQYEIISRLRDLKIVFNTKGMWMAHRKLRATLRNERVP
jgi:hypothetical protein